MTTAIEAVWCPRCHSSFVRRAHGWQLARGEVCEICKALPGASEWNSEAALLALLLRDSFFPRGDACSVPTSN